MNAMNWRRMSAWTTALALFSAASAEAGTMYSVREQDDVLVRIDTDTLEITPVGSLGMQFQFGGLAWNSTTQTLYAVDGWGGRMALWTVDTETGRATLVGAHGKRSMFGLTYDPTTDTLYGSESTRDQNVWKIDQNDGSATLVGNPNINLDGLAYDRVRDMVVGALAGPGDLHEIDRSNGNPTLLHDGPFFNNGGLTWDPDKGLFWFIDWSGNLLTFDPNNGYERETVRGGLGSHDGLAYITSGGCGDKAKLAARCKSNGTKVKAKLKKATPNTPVTFKLDGEQARQGQTNGKGKAKTTWKKQRAGAHTVTACGLENRCAP